MHKDPAHPAKASGAASKAEARGKTSGKREGEWATLEEAEEAAKADAGDPSLGKLTFLRMSGDMFEHWEEFQGFVHRMKQRDTMLP